MTDRSPKKPARTGSRTGRRAFLRTAALAALAVPAAPLIGRAAAPGLSPGLSVGLGLSGPVVPGSIRRIGKHFLVNGWVLTRADLEALDIEPV
jgi:hypothetical protein